MSAKLEAADLEAAAVAHGSVPIASRDDVASRAGALARFDNVNLLRALAAVLVVVYHVVEHSGWTSFPSEGPLSTFRIGWLGVDLFFVISGFVIGYSALALYRKDPQRFQRKYWARRLTRILPLYLLTLVAWIFLCWPGFFSMPSEAWGWHLGTHLVFLHSLWPSTFGSIDGANWSLALEMHFYLGMALLVPWIARTPGWRILAYGIAIAWAWRACMLMRYGHYDQMFLFTRVNQVPGALDEFCAGIFLAKLAIDRPVPGRAAWVPWVLGAILVGIPTMHVFWNHAGYWMFPAMVVFWRTALAISLLCVVAAAVRLPQVAAWPGLRPLNGLGEISYGIYLWHLFAIELFIHELHMAQGTALVAVLALTVLLAALSWKYLEKPMMRFARS